MAPLIVKRAYSMTDVEELNNVCRATHGDNFPTPFDISAAVGNDNKKSIFKIIRPKRKFNGNNILGFFKVRKHRKLSVCFMTFIVLILAKRSRHYIATELKGLEMLTCVHRLEWNRHVRRRYKLDLGSHISFFMIGG